MKVLYVSVQMSINTSVLSRWISVPVNQALNLWSMTIHVDIVSYVSMSLPFASVADRSVFFSSLPLDSFLGRFCITAFREYCISTPLTALVFKRNLHRVEINSPVSQSQSAVHLKVTAFPQIDLMRRSREVAVPLRVLAQPLHIFGDIRNYTEWLLRTAIAESRERHKYNPIFALVDPNSIMEVFRLQNVEAAVQPRLESTLHSTQYSDIDQRNWALLESRMKVSFLPVSEDSVDFSGTLTSSLCRPWFAVCHTP